MNIYQKLNEVRKAVDYVRKDKRVGEGGYLAVTHDAVTALTRQHFIKQGIVIVPNLLVSACVLTGTATAKGIPFIRYEARYRFDVVNADEPQDRFQVEIESHAMDQGDKAPGKALSYAKKYVVLKLLEIESGEEEEEREVQKVRITPNAGAKDALNKEQRTKVEELAGSVIDWFENGEPEKGYEAAEQAKLDIEEKLFLWTFFDSKMRRKIKEIAAIKHPFDKTTGTYKE